MSENLHPNLARIAVRYDQIVLEMQAGAVNAEKARQLIYQLEARDDHGVRWSIDPASGQFLRRTAFGELAPDTPPTFGLDTKDGFSYSNTNASNDPSWHISSQLVPPSDGDSFSLSGSTQFKSPDPADLNSAYDNEDETASALKSTLIWSSLVVSILVVFAVLFLTSG